MNGAITNNQDVIVIGAGPAGSRVAYGLAASGNSVLVIEKKQDINDSICCTGVISSDCADKFKVPRKLILREYNRATVYSPSNKRITLKRSQTQACTINRVDFDWWLARKAMRAGAKYSFGNRAKEVVVSSKGVKVTLERNGQDYELNARVLIIAAGCNSGIATTAGFKPPPHKAFGIQVDTTIDKLEEIELYLGNEIAKGYFGWAVPISETKARIGLIALRNPKTHLLKLIDKLEKQEKIVNTGEEAICRFIPLSIAPKTYKDRMLLVGDSAGQNKPTTGGGIYFGLLAADIAVDCLKEALQEDNLSEIKLRDYQKKWKILLGKDIKLGRLARSFFQHLSDRQIDKMFDIVTREEIVEEILQEKDVTFDWHGTATMRLAAKKILLRVSHLGKNPLELSSNK